MGRLIDNVERKIAKVDLFKAGQSIFTSCSTPYCSGIGGVCGKCGAKWSRCRCESSSGSCFCGEKKEGFDWWNVFTILYHQSRFWIWEKFRYWWYTQSPWSSYYYKGIVECPECEGRGYFVEHIEGSTVVRSQCFICDGKGGLRLFPYLSLIFWKNAPVRFVEWWDENIRGNNE